MQKKTVRSAECYACYRCVHGCPAPGAVEMKVAGRVLLPSVVFALLLLALFIGTDLYGRATGQWQGKVSDAEVRYLLRSSP
jgi:Fe-S-cluster-containing hydrogenase component 2